jgi:hypothetical protein
LVAGVVPGPERSITEPSLNGSRSVYTERARTTLYARPEKRVIAST